jgi:4-amino-4-deoxy-L-arabinose transferase-like glycosyltransferase
MRARNLFIIVFLALFLRTVNLESIPRWDWDEGANLNITMHLMEGRAQWFALKFPFVPHPPLFFAFASLFMKALGASILTLRLFTVILSLASILIVYFLASRLFGEGGGFLAGILYAVYPVAVYWDRMGMVNHLIVLLAVSSMYMFHAFLQDDRRRSLILSAFLAGLCPATGFIGFAAVFAVWHLTFRYNRKHLPEAAAVSLLPFTAFIAYELSVMPDYFIPEVTFQLTRLPLSAEKVLLGVFSVYVFWRLRGLLALVYDSLRMPATEAPTLGLIIISLYAMIVFPLSDENYYLGFADYLTYIFVVGFMVKPIFFLEDEQKKSLILSFLGFFFLFLVVMNRSDHMTMVIYPYLALLSSAFLVRVFGDARDFLARKKVRFYALAAIVLVYHPIFVAFSQSLGVAFGLTVGRQNIASVLAVSDYVNGLVTNDSVVIGYSWMTHLISSQFCIVGQSAAYDGHRILYYSGTYPTDRFAFNCSFRNADAIILTDGSMGVMREYDGFSELLEGIPSWDKRYISGFGVYLNPNKNIFK